MQHSHSPYKQMSYLIFQKNALFGYTYVNWDPHGTILVTWEPHMPIGPTSSQLRLACSNPSHIGPRDANWDHMKHPQDSHKPYGPTRTIHNHPGPTDPNQDPHVAIPLGLDPQMPTWTHICQLGNTTDQHVTILVTLNPHIYANQDPNQTIIVTEDSHKPSGPTCTNQSYLSPTYANWDPHVAIFPTQLSIDAYTYANWDTHMHAFLDPHMPTHLGPTNAYLDTHMPIGKHD